MSNLRCKIGIISNEYQARGADKRGYLALAQSVRSGLYCGIAGLCLSWALQSLSSGRLPRGGTPADLQAIFEERTAGARYFLVTLGGELENQPLLKDVLYNHYSLIAEGDGYVIFDLEQPLVP